MSSAPVQFLTAAFALRPSRRKAAALERVRAAAEVAYWEQLEHHRELAERLAHSADHAARRRALAAIASSAARGASRSGLPESVGAGIARDVEQTIASYMRLKQEGEDAGWPRHAPAPTAADRAAALGDLVRATTALDAAAACRDLERIDRGERRRPLVIARARDCRIVRDAAGRLAVVLNVLRAKDPRSRPADVRDGVDAATGEAIERSRRRTVLVVPLACSRWHENKFLNGNAQLRSSLVVRRGDRWFLCAQFALPVRPVQPSGAVLGIDRGHMLPAATAVVSSTGAILDVDHVVDQDAGPRIVRAVERQRRQQRRRGRTTHRDARAIAHDLHRLANGIVAQARTHRAEVVVERSDTGGGTAAATVRHGSCAGGGRRVLDKAQFGKLETILSYKLALAGLPPLRAIFAAGMSAICPACGASAAEARATGILFRCDGCGHELHADVHGAILVARRGVLVRMIPKGDKVAPLHRDMVAGLRRRDDGGLGPLAMRQRVVAAHAAASTGDDPFGAGPRGLSVVAAQEATRTAENARRGVLAERGGRTAPEPSKPGTDPAMPSARRRGGSRSDGAENRRGARLPTSAGDRFGALESAE